MADSDILRYGRKAMNYFFDSAPRNDLNPSTPIYCLGSRYDTPPPPQTETNVEPVIINHAVPNSPSESTAKSSDLTSEPEEITKSQAEPSQEHTGSQGTTSSDKGGKEDEGGWPTPFLDDFESKIWMTYRSNFQPIQRSQDPKATAAMSLAVRLRSLASQEGFTSDTGWGCMIRSGQSLLSNAMILTEKGRGE
jgi:cysteine protease ATG4